MQSMAALTQMAQGYEPVATGIPHTRRTGFEGAPFLNMGGPMGIAMSMGATPSIQRMMGGVGMIPGGMADQNVYDLLRNMRFSQEQANAIRIAAESDKASTYQMLRGMAAMTGTPFGTEQRRAAESLSSLMSAAAPIFAPMFPDLADQFGGLRGSAAVLAHRVVDAGRYRLDPTTGRLGMGGEYTGNLVNSIMNDLYSTRNIGNMGGVTAGQLGGLFQQLQSRGLISSALSESGGIRNDFARAFGNLPGMGKFSDQDMDKIMMDPGVSEKVRGFDIERVKRTLEGYVKTVSAMKDIFGDAGNPNAPMAQIIKSLEALSGNALHQIDTNRLPSLVRQTYNLAKQTGVTLDSAVHLQQFAMSKAESMGLEPIFGVQATQGGLAYGGAYRAAGYAAHPTWGALSADQMQQLDMNLRVQAAGSSMSNRMGAMFRIQGAVGFREGSEASRYLEALRLGMDRYDATGKGDFRSVGIMDESRMIEMARRDANAPLTDAAVRTFMSQDFDNREQVFKYNLQNTTRRIMGRDELFPQIGRVLQDTLRSNGAQGGNLQEASQRAITRIMALSKADFADEPKRNRMITEILNEELKAAGVQNTNMAGVSSMFYGNVNRFIQNSMYSHHNDFQGVFGAHSFAVLNEADRSAMQATITGRIQEALSPLGKGTPLQRIVDEMQNIRPGDTASLQRIVSRGLGGVDSAEINKAIYKPILDIQNAYKRIDEIRNRIGTTTDPKERADLTAQLNTAMGEYNAQIKGLVKISEMHGGLFADRGISQRDVDRAMRADRELSLVTADLHAIRADVVATKPATDIRTLQAQIQSQYGNAITPAQAYDLALSEHRAMRYGITLGNREEFSARVEEIGAAMLKQEQDRYAVTDEQITALTNKDPSITREEAKKIILTQRYTKEKQAWNAYWSDPASKATKEAAANYMQDIENIREQMIRSPIMIRRLGAQAFRHFDSMATNQQALRDLAGQFAGGSIERLFAGALTIDTSTEEGIRKRAEVMGSVASIRASLSDSINVAGAGTLGVTQYARGDFEEAKKDIFRKGDVSRDSMARINTYQEYLKNVEDMAVRYGTERNARGLLGIDPSANLTNIDRAKIDLLFGNVGGALNYLLAGNEKWTKMTPEARELAVKQLAAGGVSLQDTIDGFTTGNAALDAQLNELARLGFNTEQARAKLLNAPGNPNDPLRLVAKHGLGGTALARAQLGRSVLISDADKEVLAKIEERRREIQAKKDVAVYIGPRTEENAAKFDRLVSAHKLIGTSGLSEADEDLFMKTVRARKNRKKDGGWFNDVYVKGLETASLRRLKAFGYDNLDVIEGMEEVFQAQGALKDKYLADLNNPDRVLSKLYEAFGYADDIDSAESKALLGRMQTDPVYRDTARRMLTTQNILQSAARNTGYIKDHATAGVGGGAAMAFNKDPGRINEGISGFLKDIRNRETQEGLRRKFLGENPSVEREQAWRDVVKAAEFQHYASVEQLGAGRGNRTIGDLMHSITTGNWEKFRDEERRDRPTEITGHITGSLIISGNVGKLENAKIGGTRKTVTE